MSNPSLPVCVSMMAIICFPDQAHLGLARGLVLDTDSGTVLPRQIHDHFMTTDPGMPFALSTPTRISILYVKRVDRKQAELLVAAIPRFMNTTTLLWVREKDLGVTRRWMGRMT
jgi:hypothetical protein